MALFWKYLDNDLSHYFLPGLECNLISRFCVKTCSMLKLIASMLVGGAMGWMIEIQIKKDVDVMHIMKYWEQDKSLTGLLWGSSQKLQFN